jgi:sucrose-6-phosphate hydrolase SacC (GH32 family)
LTLADDRLVVKPAAELQTLRVTHRHIQGPMEAAIQPVPADRIELKARFEVEKAESFGFKIFDDQGEILIRFDFPVRHLRVGDELARLQFVSKTGPLDVHIFVDHSVVEVFINEREAFTAAFRPVLTATQTLKIAPFISQGTGLFTMDVWNLAEAPVTGSVLGE